MHYLKQWFSADAAPASSSTAMASIIQQMPCAPRKRSFLSGIAAVAATAKGFRAAPEKLWVHSVIGDVIAVAEAAAQLRAAVR